MKISLRIAFAMAAFGALAFCADNTLGTWKLNPEKSKPPAGQSRITSSTVVREASGDGVKVTIQGEREDKSKIDVSYTAKYDGKEVMVSGSGLPYDTIAMPYGPQVLWPDHCIQGTPGAAFHSGLQIPHAGLVVRKGLDPAIDSYSALYENDRTTPTGLTGYLRERGIARAFLAGLALDFCVRYSAEDAVREGFTVVVIEDACRGIDVQGSIAATRSSFAALRVAAIGAAEIAVTRAA